MTSWPWIVNFNRITSKESVAERLFILNWIYVSPHIGLTHHHYPYGIFLAEFQAGAVQFICTQSGQFVSEKSFKTITLVSTKEDPCELFFIPPILFQCTIFFPSGIWIVLNQFYNHDDIFHHITNHQHKCLFVTVIMAAHSKRSKNDV